MYEKVHQKIEVAARFHPGHKPEILSFVWNDKKYVVEKLTLITKARKGREVVWMYHVSTKTAAFKLRLDTDSMIWWLEEFTWEETN